MSTDELDSVTINSTTTHQLAHSIRKAVHLLHAAWISKSKWSDDAAIYPAVLSFGAAINFGSSFVRWVDHNASSVLADEDVDLAVFSSEKRLHDLMEALPALAAKHHLEFTTDAVIPPINAVRSLRWRCQAFLDAMPRWQRPSFGGCQYPPNASVPFTRVPLQSPRALDAYPLLAAHRWSGLYTIALRSLDGVTSVFIDIFHFDSALPPDRERTIQWDQTSWPYPVDVGPLLQHYVFHTQDVRDLHGFPWVWQKCLHMPMPFNMSLCDLLCTARIPSVDGRWQQQQPRREAPDNLHANGGSTTLHDHLRPSRRILGSEVEAAQSARGPLSADKGSDGVQTSGRSTVVSLRTVCNVETAVQSVQRAESK